jgi:galactokinase
LLIDCATDEVTPVPFPAGLEVVAVHSGQARALAGSAYADRRADCERAAALVGPLRNASPDDVERIADERARRRARHVVSENARVLAFVDALAGDDRDAIGSLLAASHASLRDDFEVSTPALDALVDRLRSTPGVVGARLTGAGFGGCAVAVTEPGALSEGWRLVPSAGARRLEQL